MKTVRRQSGFTLVEMIISLTVVSLLVTLVYGALRTGMRSWEASQEQAEKLNTMRIGWNVIHQALSAARQANDPLAEDRRLLFQGESERLRFIADMPSHLGLGGRYIIEIIPSEDAGQASLLFRRTLLNEYEQAGAVAAQQKAVLSDQLQTLTFHYFGYKEGETEAAWHADWLEQNALPTLVRVKIEETAGERWPVLVAQLLYSPNAQLEQSERAEQNEPLALETL